MNIQKKETFLFLEGETDKKNKLLKSDARLSEEELRRLDSGKLTIEDLNQLLAKKARIFKYGTQITVHARFPGEVNNRVNQYAYLVNNKNGSVGIRYGAIDEVKRVKLARYLSHEGFRYDKNSTRHDFTLTKTFADRDEANSYVSELKTRYDYKTLRNLIYGSIDIYGGVIWGRYYVYLLITVNAIEETNIPQFLKLMKCKSEAEITKIEEQKAEERRLRNEQWEKEREQRKIKEEAENREKGAALLAKYQKEYTTVRTMPEGTCSLCILTEKAGVVVVKQFFLKNGRKMVKMFRQEDYSLKEYQQWNDVMPPHTAKDTCRMNEAALRQYISKGVVFSKN